MPFPFSCARLRGAKTSSLQSLTQLLSLFLKQDEWKIIFPFTRDLLPGRYDIPVFAFFLYRDTNFIRRAL
jgi:hypothetical protein